MRLSLIIPALASVAALAAPSVLKARDNDDDCYVATHGFSYPDKEQYQRNLMDACLADDAAVAGSNLWGNKACFAAAASFKQIGPKTVRGLAACKNMNETVLAQQPSLYYNLYAGIVGDCAFAEGGCPVTQQNYVDFIYSTLSDIGSADFPSNVDTLISTGWQPILDWVKTNDSLPYGNFNDWLHFS
ncbi:hypothetical protein HDZ31DRAFT_71883 [Schizophyllum fasciatum]